MMFGFKSIFLSILRVFLKVPRVICNDSSCVASKLTGHATPLSAASSHVLAQTHQRSPAFKPGN